MRLYVYGVMQSVIVFMEALNFAENSFTYLEKPAAELSK